MLKAKLINKAIDSLSTTNQALIQLLTKENIKREDIASFLESYDIDNEPAVTSFLINFILDTNKYEFDDELLIPRIRGLKRFFQFNNATAIMQLEENDIVLDVDLFLKIMFPDDVRPFDARKSNVREEYIEEVLGRRYLNELRKNSSVVKINDKEILIPNECYIADLLYIKMYCTLRYDENQNNLICYIYDTFRYAKYQRPSMHVRCFIYKKQFILLLRRLYRCLIK